MAKDYTLTTWANGYGVWHCRIDFNGAGAGNGPEGLELVENARAAAQKKIRKEIIDREAPTKIRRLKYEVVANREASTGQLMSLTIAEATE